MCRSLIIDSKTVMKVLWANARCPEVFFLNNTKTNIRPTRLIMLVFLISVQIIIVINSQNDVS